MKLYDPADYVTIDEVQHSGNVFVECGHVDAVYPVSSCSVAISRRAGWVMLWKLLRVLLKGTFKKTEVDDG